MSRCSSAAASSHFIRSPSERERTCFLISGPRSSRSDSSPSAARNSASESRYTTLFTRNASPAGMSHWSWPLLPITILIRRRYARSRLNGSKPSTRTLPVVGCSNPESILRVVVLPAPFGPRKPTISPGGTSKDMSSTARTSRYLRRTRLFSEARSPASRSCTLYVFERLRTTIGDSPKVIDVTVEGVSAPPSICARTIRISCSSCGGCMLALPPFGCPAPHARRAAPAQRLPDGSLASALYC